MKFYLYTLFILFFTIQFSFGQNSAVDQSKSELPKLQTESLKIEAVVELYPNPADDYVNVTIINAQLKNVQFEMYNIIGNKIEFNFEQVNSKSYKVNVKDFHSGFYLLIVKDPVSRFNKAYKFRKR